MNESVHELATAMSIEVEKYVKLYVRPRPNWLPDFAYRWLMARVVLYESLPTVRVGEAIPQAAVIDDKGARP